ncbi:hypothetical protein HN446_05210 [bacterium]|jgi:hypothetical protein|nr:hypothetical protein [bacterium]
MRRRLWGFLIVFFLVSFCLFCSEESALKLGGHLLSKDFDRARRLYRVSDEIISCGDIVAFNAGSRLNIQFLYAKFVGIFLRGSDPRPIFVIEIENGIQYSVPRCSIVKI